MSADTETLKIAKTDTETDISADTDTETDNFRSLIRMDRWRPLYFRRPLLKWIKFVFFIK